MDALHEVEGEGGRVEEVDADAHVAAGPVHHQHLWVGVVHVHSVMSRYVFQPHGNMVYIQLCIS